MFDLNINIVCAGHCVPMSAYILPQLLSGKPVCLPSPQQVENNPKFTPGDDSLHITEQEGSWFGKS